MPESKAIRDYKMGLIGYNECLRRLNAESGRGNIHDRYAAGLISFQTYNRVMKSGTPKNNGGGDDDSVVRKLGIVAGTNVCVPDSRLGGRFGSNIRLREVKDPKLDRATKHTDLFAEMR